MTHERDIEREVFLTGIGGQGVQLAAKMLALAATAEGRAVMSLGTYGGTMRGGNTDATVVLASERVVSPPLVSRGWGAVVVHPRYWDALAPKLRPGAVVVYDADLAPEGIDVPHETIATLAVPASTLARDARAPRAGALVLLGAFCSMTALVGAPALQEAAAKALPPYRQEHVAANARALAALAPPCTVPAWSDA